MIKAILFDIGNVILFFDNHLISKRLSEITHKPEPELFNLVFSLYSEKELDLGKTPIPDYLQLLRERIGLNIDLSSLKTIFSDIFSENIKVSNLIRSLKGKIKLLAVSNTNESHFDFIADKFPILKLLDHILLSYKLGIKKPDLGIYHKAINYAGVDFKHCLFIDDQEKNTVPAEKLGMKIHTYHSFDCLIDHFYKLEIL